VIGLEAAELRLGARVILRDVVLRLEPGGCVVICGPNGAGKSTLLRALAGLLPGTPGRDPRRVAYLPQGARSAWSLTVEQVAALGRIPHGDQAAGPVDAAMQRCGVMGLRSARVDRISGGQARRAMLARAFATEPDIFLLDEPTADLDPAAAHEIMALLAATARGGKVVVVVLHALDLALRHADRMLVVAGGRIAGDGAPTEMLPVAAAAFGLPWGSDPAPRLLAP